MKANWISAAVLGFTVTACYSPNNQLEGNESVVDASVETSFSFKPEITYAKNFTIEANEHYKLVTVRNPWQESDTLLSLVLYPTGTEDPAIEQADFTIPVPIEEVVATSSPHNGYLKLIEELDKDTGVAEDKYLYNAYIYNKVSQGEVAQVGSLKSSNLEILLDVSPDLVMRTGYDNVRNEDDRLIESGIPVSYNIEWMETTMLARAEWIKYVGAFFNKDAMADSIFRQVEQEYLNARLLTTKVENRPSVMTGNNFKGTWYMPSADSYLTKLILDAGGDYHYKDEQATGSLPLSFEVVLDDMIEADYWIGPRAESLKELEMMDERYTLFKAFRAGNVYTFNERMSENGGNDYWESGMTRPDLILKDVIKIFHPELLPNHQLYYYKKLQ
ncbi:MAG: ABC transporter substrate-binding protein [Cyclobacteriaceae bacterium]